MGMNRIAVHALVVCSIAALAHGASDRGSAAEDVRRDTTRPAAAGVQGTSVVRPRVIFYGRLGVPFMARDGRIALSGAPLRPRRSNGIPDSPARSCPAQAASTPASGAPELVPDARVTTPTRGGA